MDELKRIRNAYSHFEESDNYKKLHTPFGLSSYYQDNLKRKLIFIFRKKGFLTLNELKVLDVGIGKGSNVPDFFKFGINFKSLFGLDILFDRLRFLKNNYKEILVFNCDAQKVSFKNKSFDIVTQFVVFSSILEDNVCQNIATEMLRVLKDDGMIIWYDAHGGKMLSEHTRSYSEEQIKEFFPNCKYEFKRIIPHSQLSLRLGKYEWGWVLLDIIEKIFPFLNCMQLCVIKKK